MITSITTITISITITSIIDSAVVIIIIIMPSAALRHTCRAPLSVASVFRISPDGAVASIPALGVARLNGCASFRVQRTVADACWFGRRCS